VTGGLPVAYGCHQETPEGHQAATAAAHWEALADSQLELARWYEEHGLPFGNVSSYRFRAETYQRTAEALRREASTGRPHCSQCGGDHANHDHSSLAAEAYVKACDCKQPSCPWCRRA
jgi:hypothetical protein